MEATSAVSALSPTTPTGQSQSFSELGSGDFLSLLITQLRNQDPLEPMGNEELLKQISSVREIELSTTLTESLKSLAGQQRFGSASSMIGQHVTGVANDGTMPLSGIVVGVRFAEGGQPVLQLSDGSELSVDQVATIQPPVRFAEALIGAGIVGVDRRDPANTKVVEGVVTGVRTEPPGEVMLELDSGENLRLRDFVQLSTMTTN